MARLRRESKALQAHPYLPEQIQVLRIAVEATLQMLQCEEWAACAAKRLPGGDPRVDAKRRYRRLVRQHE